MSVLYVKHTEVSFEVKKKKNELIKKNPDVSAKA